MSGTTAEIEMKARCAGRAGVAAMAMAAGHGAAVMAEDAVAEDGVPVAVMADDDAFAIHRRAAGAAVVREAAAGVVAVKGLRTGRSKDSKAGGGGEEGEKFFHDQRRFALDLLPHSCGVCMRRRPAACIRDSSRLFSKPTRISANGGVLLNVSTGCQNTACCGCCPAPACRCFSRS